MSEKHIISRVFDNSPEDLFNAHSNPDVLASWFPPSDTQKAAFDIDFRPGGYMKYVLEYADRKPIWGRFDYLDIEKPNTISLVQSLTDANGILISPVRRPHWLFRLRTDIVIQANANQTEILMTVSLHGGELDEQGFFNFLWPQISVGYDSGLDRLSRALAVNLYN